MLNKACKYTGANLLRDLVPATETRLNGGCVGMLWLVCDFTLTMYENLFCTPGKGRQNGRVIGDPVPREADSFLTRNTRSVERVTADGDKYSNFHSFLPSIRCKRFLVIPLPVRNVTCLTFGDGVGGRGGWGAGRRGRRDGRGSVEQNA